MLPNHINSKVSGDCGTSGRCSGPQITRPTRREKMFQALKVIYLRINLKNHELILDIGKDRNGNHGVKELPEAIDSIAELLSQYKFQGSNEMFQTSLSLRLSEVMKDVLIGDDYIPTAKAIKEYMEGG